MASKPSTGSSSSTKAPSVEYRHNVALGKHEVGVVVDGHFVPFAQLDDAVVAQRVENAASLVAAGGNGEGNGGE